MAYKKCAGMDQRFWTPEDIAEYPCPRCKTSVEIWKNDVKVPCPSCGFSMVNPRLSDVCLAWCDRSSECLGSRDIDDWKKTMAGKSPSI